VKEHADHSGLRLLLVGSISGLVVGAWLWGILTLGAHHAMVDQRPPSQMANPSQGTWWLRALVRTAPRKE
jgi:hypothetical protein